jgi:glycerol-1-phosphate dehydrogenase [NAD(P)+]
VKTGRNILSSVPEMISVLGAKKTFVLCDLNTYKAAGEKVCAILKEANLPHTLYVLPVEKPGPDEWTIGNVLMHLDPACDLILGVGSGVINDVCKEVAFKSGRKNAIVGTAPSMDGFASATGSMELDHVKVSLNNQCPQGILLDGDVLCQAPMRMLWAGYGDMVAKYVAICEWRITNLITGEYYCEAIADLMRAALKKISANVDKLMQRDPDAALAVAEGLLIAGMGMAFAGCSRPASGIEHYFSHMWEMMALERGLPYDLHGIMVGVGTVMSMRLYEFVKQQKPDRARMEAHAAAFDYNEWEAQVRRVFGKTADEIIRIEGKVQKNDPARLAKRIDALCENWDKILKIIDEELPEYNYLYGMMKDTGMPVEPRDLDICDEDVINAYLGARDIRDKYLSCSFLWDMGLQDEAVAYLKSTL